MGSALFGPLFWRGQRFGQVITTAPARNTYGPIDLGIFMGFAHAWPLPSTWHTAGLSGYRPSDDKA